MWNCSNCNCIMSDSDKNCNGCGCPRQGTKEYEIYIEQQSKTNNKQNIPTNTIEIGRSQKINAYTSHVKDFERNDDKKIDDEIQVMIDKRILHRKKIICGQYGLELYAGKMSEKQYDLLIKYKDIKTDDDNLAYHEDGVAKLFNIISGASFALFFIGGILDKDFMMVLWITGFITGFLFMGIGRIISLLNVIKSK